MSSWQKVVLRGATAILLFDTVMSIASRSLGFAYTSGAIGSFLIYLAVGYFGARATGLIRWGTLAGGIVGLVDATLGWWISWQLGAGELPETVPAGLRVAGIVITAIWVTLGAALTGAVGGVVGSRRHVAPPDPVAPHG